MAIDWSVSCSANADDWFVQNSCAISQLNFGDVITFKHVVYTWVQPAVHSINGTAINIVINYN